MERTNSTLRTPAEDLSTQNHSASIPVCNCTPVDEPGVGITHAAGCPLRRVARSVMRHMEARGAQQPTDSGLGFVDVLIVELNSLLDRLHNRRGRRDELLGQLIFAARDLAQRNLMLAAGVSPHADCCECFMGSVNSVITHTTTCKTGRVLIIDGLLETSDFNGEENAADLETNRAGDGIRLRGLNERVCLKCGERGGDWVAEAKPEGEVELSSLGLNQCVGAPFQGESGHTLYTHRCRPSRSDIGALFNEPQAFEFCSCEVCREYRAEFARIGGAQ